MSRLEPGAGETLPAPFRGGKPRSQTPDHRNGAEGQLPRVSRGPYCPSARQHFNRHSPQPSRDTVGRLLTVICQLNALIKCANITKLSDLPAMEKLPLFYGGVPVAAAGGRGGSWWQWTRSPEGILRIFIVPLLKTRVKRSQSHRNRFRNHFLRLASG